MQFIIFYTDSTGWKRSTWGGGYAYEVWTERRNDNDWQIEIKLDDIQRLQFDNETGNYVIVTKIDNIL